MNWHGTIAGAVLPFDAAGAIDWAGLERHLATFENAGLAGVVVNADTGEGGLLGERERLEVARFAVERIGARVPVLAGLVPGATAAGVAEARAMAAAGVAGFQVFTPAVFAGAPLGWEPVVAHYHALAAATDVPLVVYSAPTGLGVTFDVDVLRRVAEIPGVAAIKESSWSRERAAATAAAFGGDRHRVTLLTGEDTFILDALRGGADGAMLAVAAVDPSLYAELVADRHGERAALIQAALDPLIAAVFAPPLRDFRARLKALLAAAGQFGCAAVRAPLAPIPAAEAHSLVDLRARALSELGR